MKHYLSTSDGESAMRAFEVAAVQAFHSIMITEIGDHGEDHNIIFVNKAFTDMTGYTAEEIIGKTPRLLQGVKTDQAVLDELRNKLNSDNSFHGTTVNYRKDGSEFTIEWKVIPVRDNNGVVTHHVAVQRDVT